MAIPAVLLGLDERFELVVGEEGILPIPETLRVALRLKPGEIEIVAVDRLRASLFLETFSAFLDALGEAVPVEQQWDQVVQRFFTRTLIVLEERGLPIPADLFPLPVGATLRLQAAAAPGRTPGPRRSFRPSCLSSFHSP